MPTGATLGYRFLTDEFEIEHGIIAGENRVQRNFSAKGPNRLWVADTTYVHISSGFAYTASATDVFSRKVVGWAVASAMTTEALPPQALDQAIFAARKNTGGLVHHADHGSQYCSITYGNQLEKAGIKSWTGTVGDSDENALAETVNGLYKSEMIYPQGPWRSSSQVELATLEWVDWWKKQRLHETLDYSNPVEVENANNQTCEAEAAILVN